MQLFLRRNVSKYDQNLLPHSLEDVLACAIIVVLFVVLILIDDVIDVFSRVEILDFDRPHVNQQLLVTFKVAVGRTNSTLRVALAISVCLHERIHLDLGMQVASGRGIDLG